MEKLTLTLTFESPYTDTGVPRADLPTGEVLAWDGEEWMTGKLNVTQEGKVNCQIMFGFAVGDALVLRNVKRFAPLPTIYENED